MTIQYLRLLKLLCVIIWNSGFSVIWKKKKRIGKFEYNSSVIEQTAGNLEIITAIYFDTLGKSEKNIIYIIWNVV